MKKSILKFLEERGAVLWIKTYDSQETMNMVIESLNNLENKKFYIYEKGKTINQQENILESKMNELFTTLDELYPQGIRKTPVFLLIKESAEEILKKNNLDYIKEIVETKRENPKYNFTIIIIDNENIPTQLNNLASFVDKLELDNENNIRNYILNLSKFEKINLNSEEIEEVISLLKSNIRKIANKKKQNIEENKFKDMIFVKGGSYKPEFVDEEKEVFDIEVCKYLVTQDIWQEIMKDNPSNFQGEKRPVDSVTWWEALEYCNKLSEKYNLEPVYDLSQRKQGILKIFQLNSEVVYPDVADFQKTEGFRLPTQIEWEWFARGGEIAIQEETFEYKYSGSDNIDEVAWYNMTASNKTHNVGLKKANQLGLYDCTGNIWEWCYDTIEGSIPQSALYIYTALDSSKKYRELRGGSWANGVDTSTVTFRDYYDASYGESNIGFRIVRTI